MAGDWIKMRGALIQSPRLIAMARQLHRCREFRDWLSPGGGGPTNGQLVSDDALRCVTCALLLRVWSAAREFGKLEGDHLLLPHISIPDLDLMASAPCVGKAMVTVGWAEVKAGDHGGVLLPNFKQHNAPMTPAEKQSAYRDRAKSRPPDDANGCVTSRYQSEVTKRSPEKRREENNKTPLPPKGGTPKAAGISRADLSEIPKLRRWMSRKRGQLKFSNPAWAFPWIIAAADKALEVADDPVGMFLSLAADIASGDTAKVGDERYDQAKKKLREESPVAELADAKGIDDDE